jgi:hypothetical protein
MTHAALLHEDPVSGTAAHPPLPRDANVAEYLDGLNQAAPTATSPNSGPQSVSLRICNNALTTLSGLDRVMPHLLAVPMELTWLDVSCNKLTRVEDVLNRFPKLQVRGGVACWHT